MTFPNDLLYTADHEWVRIDGDIAFVGITDFAQKELGDIVFVDINSVGKVLEKHEIFGTVEAVKTVSDLFLPIKGEILEVNPKLNSNPELVNQDPYGDGWMVKVKILDNDTSHLLSSDQYQNTLSA